MCKICISLLTDMQILHYHIYGGAKMGELKELRIEKKLTQQAVADLVGISLRSYISYESDDRKRDTIKYKYLQIGNIKNSGRSEVYNSNDFNNGYVPEMISTFQLDRSFQIALVEVPPKIRNINPYSSEHINLIHQLEKYLDDDVKNWFLNEAKSYPSPDCIYISKGKIYAVLDQKFLKAIKDYLGDNS